MEDDDPLPRLAALIHEIAADLGALPPGLRDPVRKDLRQFLQRAAAMAGAVRALHGSQVAGQLERLTQDLTQDLRIAITGTAPPPWITVGFPPATVVANLGRGLPFQNGAARYVYFALALEHFFYPGQAQFLVREIRRVLADDGAVRIVVPDIGAYARAYARDDRTFFEGHRRYWDWAEKVRTPMEFLQVMSGAGGGRGHSDFFGHKNGYDFETLEMLLHDNGFRTVERVAYREGAIAELILDEYSHDAGFACGDESYSLFVEARP
ncbi:MAG: hypothetical protein K8W52_13695 [Deltaproteobacteria bacterium]|nr:hypothetical protein [Deltaproteobacteria bacterium]